MNWIIRNTKKLDFHTDLKELLKPILDEIEDFNWVISDLDFISDKILPINHDHDFFILSSSEFKEILSCHTQFIWGVISGFPKSEVILIDENDLPYAEGNDMIWKNGNFQIQNAALEIIAFDSSYTIIKFKNEQVSEKFKKYFEEAVELEKI
ncbi:hypothetical protein [Flavobacterium reichenbachii]|uniref:hypothetical protein n=1 Tax=Flavobacterium reichenbachii TaxID=362418 RepID=UPI00068EA78C|nr:hypothetical protein [Flavobacterium reichenbachii]OXB18745.1 hypothetical protein B0A68_01650 [Flavobacterium reichenbachii]